MNARRSSRLLAFLLAAAGCGSPGCGGPTPPARGLPGDIIQLEIKGQTLAVEVACDALSRQRGLMERETLGERSAMLFIFPDVTYQSFWMHNTLVPLSIAFLDDSGKIQQIEDMRPKDESRTRSKSPVRYALEVNQGWFARHGIQVGDTLLAFPDKVNHFSAGRR